MMALLVNGHPQNLIQAYAGRLLRLLQEVESGREFLSANMSIMRSTVESTATLLAQLRDQNPATALDPDGKVSELLTQGAESARRSREAIQARLAAAKRGGSMTPQLQAAFTQFVDVTTEIHNSIEDMREWVETHDALLEKPSGRPMKSAAELFSRLGVKNAA